jgi:hypothetical protein
MAMPVATFEYPTRNEAWAALDAWRDLHPDTKGWRVTVLYAESGVRIEAAWTEEDGDD